MIEIKAEAEILDNDGMEAGIRISNETHGTAHEIFHESLAIVRSLTSTLRRNDPLMLVMFLDALKNDHSILLGEGEGGCEDKDIDKAAEFERLVATTKFREGVN